MSIHDAFDLQEPLRSLVFNLINRSYDLGSTNIPHSLFQSRYDAYKKAESDLVKYLKENDRALQSPSESPVYSDGLGNSRGQ